MAWQLIYTSAPRLLEAGRTGFGTVARHRAVSGMLAAAVERFSQFARLPGHDPRRVVHTCRILTVGSGTFHVFSCLQDAGSDYTGRTNHIAHHLIAEPREIRTLAAAGLTPADVLMGMAWRTSWSEGPRYLDSAEEIDLASFASQSSHAWFAVTGNPASAGILWSREALKGCYLIAPAAVNVLELFRESLQASPAQAWQTRFTTCLEPNDDLADFRWVGLSSSSPMRSQVETSNRLVLDLTRPSSLPAPPEAEAPAPAIEAPRPTAPPPPPTQFQATVPPKAPLPSAGADPISAMGGWSPETPTRQRASKGSRSYIGLSLVIAALLIVAVSGGLLWQFKQQQQQNNARSAYESAIQKLWKTHHLQLEETRKYLEEQTNLEGGQKLLKSHKAFFSSVKQLLDTPEKASELSLPDGNQDDVGEFKKRLDEWVTLHKNPWEELQNEKKNATATSLYQASRKWEQSRAALWKKLDDYVDQPDPPPLSPVLLQPLKDIVKEVFSRAEPERGSHTQWSDLFDLVDRQKSPMDAESQHWLKLWADLDGLTPRAAAEKHFADNTLPGWLREKVKSVKDKLDKAGASMVADTNKKDSADKANETEKPKVMEDADAIPAKHDIHVLLLKPGDDFTKATGLKVETDMQLYVGGVWDAHSSSDGKTEPKNDELKPLTSVTVETNHDYNFGPSKLSQLHDMIRISSSGALLALPDQYRNAANGLRLVGRRKDGVEVLFDLRLIASSSVVAKPILAKEVPATADNSSTATLRLPEGFIPKLHLLGMSNPVYSLRQDGTSSEQKVYGLKYTADSAFEVMAPQTGMSNGINIQSIRQQITELEAGIQKDDADIAALEKTNLNARDKDTRNKEYNNRRSEKEIKLLTLRPQLQSLESLKPVHFDLMPGNYTLLIEHSGNKLELCKLKVEPAANTHAPKPPAP